MVELLGRGGELGQVGHDRAERQVLRLLLGHGVQVGSHLHQAPGLGEERVLVAAERRSDGVRGVADRAARAGQADGVEGLLVGRDDAEPGRLGVADLHPLDPGQQRVGVEEEQDGGSHEQQAEDFVEFVGARALPVDTRGVWRQSDGSGLRCDRQGHH
ncbi:MAG: hypothetical protein QM765_14465 [Myxococcales bacterium]